MKFEKVYGRTLRGGLSQAEAAEVLGVSERTFRRWRDRYEAEGADGLYDRRLGRASARRAPVDEVLRVLALFDTRYWDFTSTRHREFANSSVEDFRDCVRLHVEMLDSGCCSAHRSDADRRGNVLLLIDAERSNADAEQQRWR